MLESVIIYFWYIKDHLWQGYNIYHQISLNYQHRGKISIKSDMIKSQLKWVTEVFPNPHLHAATNPKTRLTHWCVQRWNLLLYNFLNCRCYLWQINDHWSCYHKLQSSAFNSFHVNSQTSPLIALNFHRAQKVNSGYSNIMEASTIAAAEHGKVNQDIGLNQTCSSKLRRD